MLVALFADADGSDEITQAVVLEDSIHSPHIPSNSNSLDSEDVVHDDYIEQATPTRKRSAPSVSSVKKRKKSRRSSVAQPVIASIESVALLISTVCLDLSYVRLWSHLALMCRLCTRLCPQHSLLLSLR
jgi:hypothetical protein